MKMFKALLVLVLVGGPAIPANADARTLEITDFSPQFTGIRYVQSEIDALAPSQQRRFLFYAERAMTALDALNAEDSGTIITERAVDNFRDAVLRLIDAGDRSGLSQDIVANYFKLAIQAQYTQGFPLAVSDSAGNIDTLTLFENVVAFQIRKDLETADMPEMSLANVLKAYEGDIEVLIDPQDDQSNQVAQIAPEATGSPNVGPVVPEGASAATRTILQRVQVQNNGDWVIQIVAGDSLSSIAAAMYGDSLIYRRLFSINTNVMDNPNLLEVGTLIQLPKEF